jgi:uncharacterized membrane protein YagU involved in acid resistance
MTNKQMFNFNFTAVLTNKVERVHSVCSIIHSLMFTIMNKFFCRRELLRNRLYQLSIFVN